MAKAEQGGPGEILAPVQAAQNSRKRRLSSETWTHERGIYWRIQTIRTRQQNGSKPTLEGVGDGEWYFKFFQNYVSASAPYYAALETPKDFDICTSKDKKEDDPSRTVITRKEGRGPNNRVDYYMMNVDAGDQWRNKYSAASSTKRDEEERRMCRE